MRTGVIIDERFTRHEATANHPERPERLAVLLELVDSYTREGIERLEPRHATDDEILANHDRSLLDAVRRTADRDAFAFDPDTHTNRLTYDTAMLAAGGLLSLLDEIVAGTVDNGFALVRPPGHHAEADRAMGFCFFNNVAIGARYLQQKHGMGRVLIMDWDVHHGNGTQRSFYADSSVLYLSTHEAGNYPGTGSAHEIGDGEGRGFTVNVPLPSGAGDAEYIDVFGRVIEPISRQFDPDFVLISAGFDHHRLDPLGGMMVTTKGIASMTQSLLAVARDHASGRCALVLEGGYSLTALRESVACVLDELGRKGEVAASGTSAVSAVIDAVTTNQREYWKL